MDGMIQQYADHLRHERNFSTHTLRNYLSDLAQFHEFLRERELCVDADGKIHPASIDVHVIRSYLAALAKDRLDALDETPFERFCLLDESLVFHAPLI